MHCRPSEEFGKNRVFNTPLCEQGIAGMVLMFETSEQHFVN